MADLPSDHIELFSFEIYDESPYPDHELIWLSSDEEAPTLAQTAESFETMPWALCGPEAMASDCPSEDPWVIPDSARHPSSNTDVRSLPRNSSAGDGSAGILFSSLLPTNKAFSQFNLTRRLFRVAA